VNSIDSKPVLHSEETEAEPSIALWSWVAVLVWIGVIFFTSTSLASRWAETTYTFVSGTFFDTSAPNYKPSTLMHLIADKGFHVAIFCVLAMLLWIALATVRRKFLAILLCGALVGSCSEFLQRFFPDRDPALRDVLINTIGTALGALLCVGFQSLVSKRSQRTHADKLSNY
jgi:VanZ family protein